MNEKYIIYAFLDGENNPYYIGKTCNLKSRIKRHFREISKGINTPKCNKLKKLIKSGVGLKVCVIEDNISAEEINAKEIYYISKFKEKGYRLCNLTRGGDGFDSHLAKILRSKRVYRFHNKKTRELISLAKKGIKFSEEHKNKLKIAWETREPMSKESRLKQSKSAKGIINIKKYVLISPKGKKYITKKGLTLFCEQHSLNRPNLFKVLKGERKHSKKWRIERYVD